jgi:hypothetical protein
LQSDLRSWGFTGKNGRSLAVDGKYGADTRWAHWNYFFFREVKADGAHPEGMCDEYLCYRHFKESAKKALRQEFGGKLESITVRDLQKFLKKNVDRNLAVDGQFGPATRAATFYFIFDYSENSYYRQNKEVIPQASSDAQVNSAEWMNEDKKTEWTNVKVGNNTVHVKYETNVMRLSLQSGDALYMVLASPQNAAEIAIAIKAGYKEKMGEEIDISTDSVAMEILGHAYPETAAIAMAMSGEQIPSYIADEMLSHTNVIDIGTEAVDSNRWVWDKLVDCSYKMNGWGD